MSLPANSEPWVSHARIPHRELIHLSSELKYPPGTVFPLVRVGCGQPEGTNVGDPIETLVMPGERMPARFENWPLCLVCVKEVGPA